MPPDDGPRGWMCDCGNVLGVMHRNGSNVMVVDTFREQVAGHELVWFVSVATQRDYASKDLKWGNVICPSCGRSNVWDASEQLFKRFMERKAERTYGLDSDHGV